MTTITITTLIITTTIIIIIDIKLIYLLDENKNAGVGGMGGMGGMM
jgi:hypothetical protein